MTSIHTEDPYIAELRHRLSSDDPGVRRVALLDFADVEDEALLPAIVGVLRQDPDPVLRAEAARALAGWGDGDVVDALADALADAPVVREAAAQALSELKDAVAGARLVSRARHDDGFVYAATLRALKELRIPAAAEPAVAALGHADAAVRREAVGVLGWLRHAASLPRLAQLAMSDAHAEVRRTATGALGLAAPQDASGAPPLPQDLSVVLPALCAAARNEAWQVREEAATTLGKLGPWAQAEQRAAVCAALRDAMDDDFWQVRVRAARSLGRLRDTTALPVLIEALAHRAGNLRKEAAIALGEIGDARALPALTVAANDPDPEVRKAVRLAVQRLP